MSVLKSMYDEEQKEIPTILAFFGLPTLKKATLIEIDAGAANHNWLCVTADDQEFVIKFPIEESKESLENDRVIAEQLITAGIQSPTYLENSSGNFVYDGRLAAVISRRIRGVHPHNLDQTTAKIIGKALAQFHTTVKHLHNPHKGWLNPEIAARAIPQESHSYTKKARALIDNGLIMFKHDLPRGIIHSDVHADNVFVAEDDLARLTTILDLEESEENLFIIDIACSVLAICKSKSGMELDKGLIDALIEGYESVRKLTNDEQAHFNRP